jgi:hypothetical protein
MIPDWNRRIEASIKKEKAEVESKYGIRIGQTEIYCIRCGRPWGYGNHICQDIRFEKLRMKKEKRISELKKSKSKAFLILSDLGSQKTAILLMIPEGRVNKWIQRESIPEKYIEKILNL